MVHWKMVRVLNPEIKRYKNKTYDEVILDSSKSYTIGRGNTCDIRLTSLYISRLHCQISFTDTGTPQVCAYKSENGTYLNGKRLSEDLPTTYTSLVEGDNIGISIDRNTDRSYWNFKLVKTIEMPCSDPLPLDATCNKQESSDVSMTTCSTFHRNVSHPQGRPTTSVPCLNVEEQRSATLTKSPSSDQRSGHEVTVEKVQKIYDIIVLDSDSDTDLSVVPSRTDQPGSENLVQDVKSDSQPQVLIPPNNIEISPEINIDCTSAG